MQLTEQQVDLIPLHPVPTLPVGERKFAAEVETGFTADTASAEASRCYLCHYKFEIIDEKCVLRDECLNVKPVEGCIVEIASLARDDEGHITGYTRVEQSKTNSL
jgi:hypothetical protein